VKATVAGVVSSRGIRAIDLLQLKRNGCGAWAHGSERSFAPRPILCEHAPPVIARVGGGRIVWAVTRCKSCNIGVLKPLAAEAIVKARNIAVGDGDRCLVVGKGRLGSWECPRR
jgi:hypothetical protein